MVVSSITDTIKVRIFIALFCVIINFVQQFNILSDKPGQGGILVSNAPPLENDDGYQHQYNDDDGGGQCYGDDHGKIHTLCSFNPAAKV